MTTISLRHVDTCLSCYVTDHCNGPDEVLLGVPVDGRTTYEEVKSALMDEFNASADERLEDVSNEMFKAELDDQWSTVTDPTTKLFDASLEITPEDYDGDECYAWFRLSIDRDM